MKIDGFDALMSMISRVISSHVASQTQTTQTEGDAGTASFGAVLSSMSVVSQRVSFGDWIQENGTWYRSVTPPHQTRGVSYYADAEGRLYAKSVVPGATMRSVETPDWFSGMMPGNPPVSVALSTNQQAAYSYGDTVTIGEKEYTAVVPPGGANRGSQYLVDGDGKWYRLSSARDAEPRAIEAPSWWDRVLPNGETLASISTQGQTAYAFGDTVTIGEKEYTAVVPPGGANRGSQYLIDNDGNWYRLSSARDAEPKAIDAPSWWDGALPSGETVVSSLSSPASSLEYLRFGPWENIDGTMYRTAWLPGIQNRGGEYLIDKNFSWYYRTSAEGSVPRAIDVPDWFLQS